MAGRKPRTQTVEAIVLRHADWGEADRILTVFSRQAGKLRAIAKGARRLRSRKAGHLEPFTRVKLLLAQGRDFWIITQAEMIDGYPSAREDLLRTGYAAYLCELLDRFTYEEGDAPGLFDILADGLARVSSLSDPIIALRYFELRLLDHSGFRPQLFECVSCGEKIEARDQFFDFALGGVVCPRCGPGIANARPVSMDTLRFLRHLQRSRFGEAARAEPGQSTRDEMERLMQGYLTWLLERKLNTPGFIAEARAMTPPAETRNGD